MQPDPPLHIHNYVPAQTLLLGLKKSVVATLPRWQQAPPLNKTALKYHKITFEVFMDFNLPA